MAVLVADEFFRWFQRGEEVVERLAVGKEFVGDALERNGMKFAFDAGRLDEFFVGGDGDGGDLVPRYFFEERAGRASILLDAADALEGAGVDGFSLGRDEGDGGVVEAAVVEAKDGAVEIGQFIHGAKLER